MGKGQSIGEAGGGEIVKWKRVMYLVRVAEKGYV